MFKVCAEQCDQCLFTPNRIVSVKRMKQLLKQLAREDSYFECHKHTINQRSVCCRGDYNRNPHRTNLMRIAHRLNAVRFVDLEGREVSSDGNPE